MKNLSRRQFLGASSAAFAFQFVPSRVWGANERINVAGIGVGGKGTADVASAANAGANIVALCDVDTVRGAKSIKTFSDAKVYSDFREMLDKQKDIDAVTISAPDHIHAVAAMAAMDLGKHIYCQKPLTHSIHEARVLTEAAAKNKLVTQMGNQAHVGEPIRRAVELVRAGIIGKVSEVHVWTNRPIWPQGLAARPPKEKIPEGLDWDLWLGPAPKVPYSSKYVPFKWRGWWDYGTGALGDMACHTTNLAFMSCGLTQPTSVESVNTGPINDETFPSWATIDMDFPKTDKRGPIKFHWYEGKVGNNGKDNKGEKNLPPMDLLHGETPKNSGLLLVGTDGVIYSPNDYGADWKIYKDGKWTDRKNVELPSPTIPRNGRGDNGMKEELVKAIREGNPKIAMSNFDYAGNMTEAILLGNVAMRAGGKFTWDAAKMKTNRPDTDKLISKVYRGGWEVDPA